MTLHRYHRIRKIINGIGTLLAIFTLSLMTLSGTAYASISLIVKVSHGGSYTVATSQVILDNGGVNIVCSTSESAPASSGAGALKNGTHAGAPPVTIGTVSTWAFSSCDQPLSGKTTITAKSLPYAINVDSATNKSGDTDLTISSIAVRVSAIGCSFAMTGSVPGYYVNGTHKLHITSALPITAMNKARLTISGVHGCFGVWKDGDHPTFTTIYPLSIPVKISST